MSTWSGVVDKLFDGLVLGCLLKDSWFCLVFVLVFCVFLSCSLCFFLFCLVGIVVVVIVVGPIRTHSLDLFGARVQDFCSVLVITDEGTVNGQCDQSLDLSTSLAVQGSHLCMDVQVTGRNPYDLGKETAATYCPCHITVDMENNNLDNVKIHDETGGSIKNEIALTKPLRRQNSLQPGGEPVQPFMDHILMLLKLDAKDKQTAERANDVPNNKWKKYKRPAALDSRQIVLLFSILSSMGTIVLIYLTLRVRQAGEGFVLA